MSGRRTEAPTPRRLRRAREQGEVATSRQLSGTAALVGGAAALVASGPFTTGVLARAFATALSGSCPERLDPQRPLREAVLLLALAALPPCGAAALAAAVAGALQTGGLVTVRAVRFRLDRLDPRRRLASLVAPSRLAAGALAGAEAACALALAWRAVHRAAPLLAGAPRLGTAALLRFAAAVAREVSAPLLALLLAAGALDLALARRRHLAGLRMTRDEVLREHREDQGDPRLRGERRRLHRALAGAGPLQRAACLVVNPTHLAVALEHAPGSDAAPVVLAKASGAAAARLRRRARRAGIPVVRDVALARALFRLAEVGDQIPAELYQAAAAVLVHVHGGAREATW